MSYAKDNNHDLPYDMLEYLSSEDTDWDSEWVYSEWVCKDGTVLAIENMETSHIKNSIAMIERSVKNNKPWRLEYLESLKEELSFRQ